VIGINPADGLDTAWPIRRARARDRSRRRGIVPL